MGEPFDRESRYPCVHRGQTDTHEYEVYQTAPAYFQGRYRGLHGNAPTLWNRGQGGKTLEDAIRDVRSRIAWESAAAADGGYSLHRS